MDNKQQSKDIVKPLFHYTYKNQAIILDSQYNYQGNMLAVSNSNGDVIFYQADSDQQNREMLFAIDQKKTPEKRNNAILKVAWSLPNFGLFATISISKEIDLYRCSKTGVEAMLCKKSTYIPIYINFCPIQTQVIMSIGFSDGSIILYNQDLKQICSQQAHEAAVNCLSWQHKILTYQKNKWIINNFSHIKKFNTNDQFPMLISGSSDCHFKVWKYQKKKLIQMCRILGHSKSIREVQWKPVYLGESDKLIITCSEDGYVKIWKIKAININKMVLQKKCQRNFGGPVYKAKYNFMGNLIAISYCNDVQQRVQTIIMQESLDKQISIYA